MASLHVAAVNEAVVELAPYNLGNVSDAGDPGSIPDGGKLIVCPSGCSLVRIEMTLFKNYKM